MLNNFRTTDITWDKASRRIYSDVRASSSDEKGRRLVVQILNDGQVEDLTGTSLNLYWETKNGVSGLDPFTAVDISRGVFEIYYRTGMLQHVGDLKGLLYLADTTGTITSEPFTIRVIRGIDSEAVASEDELSVLGQALINVNEAILEISGIADAEQARVISEESRISAEAERVNNENARKTLETERESNETSRMEAEIDRKTAESGRITAENERVIAEAERIMQEQARIAAEAEREPKIQALEDQLAEQAQAVADNKSGLVGLDYKDITNDCTYSNIGTYAFKKVLVIEKYELIYIHISHAVDTEITTSKWVMQLPTAYRPLALRFIPWATRFTTGVCEIDDTGVLRAYVQSGKSTGHFRISGVIHYNS